MMLYETIFNYYDNQTIVRYSIMYLWNHFISNNNKRAINCLHHRVMSIYDSIIFNVGSDFWHDIHFILSMCIIVYKILYFPR